MAVAAVSTRLYVLNYEALVLGNLEEELIKLMRFLQVEVDPIRLKVT